MKRDLGSLPLVMQPLKNMPWVLMLWSDFGAASMSDKEMMIWTIWLPFCNYFEYLEEKTKEILCNMTGDVQVCIASSLLMFVWAKGLRVIYSCNETNDITLVAHLWLV